MCDYCWFFLWVGLETRSEWTLNFFSFCNISRSWRCTDGCSFKLYMFSYWQHISCQYVPSMFTFFKHLITVWKQKYLESWFLSSVFDRFSNRGKFPFISKKLWGSHILWKMLHTSCFIFFCVIITATDGSSLHGALTEGVVLYISPAAAQ